MARQLLLAFGFLISPLASLILVLPIAAFSLSSQDLQSARDAVIAAAILYPLMLLAALLLGFPTYVLLSQVRLVNFFSALVAGAVIGAMVGFALFFQGRAPSMELVAIVLGFALLGALNSIVFYGFVRLAGKMEGES